MHATKTYIIALCWRLSQPPINPRRRAIINLAFATLDQDEDDKITIEEMQEVYRARFDPKAKTGELTESQAREVFFRQFEGGRPGTVVSQSINQSINQ